MSGDVKSQFVQSPQDGENSSMAWCQHKVNFDASVVQLLVCVWVVAFGTPRSRSDTTNGVCEDQCLLRQHVDTVVRLYKSSAKSLDPGGAAIPGWGSQKVPKQMRSHNRWSFG